MSDESGCGRALVRLVSIPAVMGLLGALLPMGFGRPFAWHIGFIAFVLGLAVRLGVRFWKAEDGPEAPTGERVEHVAGELTLASASVVVGDGPDLRGQVRIDRLPATLWRAKCRTLGPSAGSLLEEVVLEADAVEDARPLEDRAVVIDSGEVVVVDAGAMSKRFRGGTLKEEIERLHREAQPPQGGVTLLLDERGTACGLTFCPPFGDGEYPVYVEQRGGVLEIRIRVGGDA